MLRLLLFVTFLLICNSSPAQLGKFRERLKKVGVNKQVKKLAKSEKAKEFLVKQLTEARAEYDTISFNYAIALSDNAGLFESKERYERHKKFLLTVLTKDQDKSPLERAIANNDAGEMLYAAGKFKMARNRFRIALNIFRSNGLTHNIHFYKNVANMGLLFHTAGRYTQAEKATRRALELRKENLGESTVAYASSLNNLAVLEKDMGNYNESERLIARAIEVNRSSLGENSLPYAISLNNQAILFQTIGRTEEAEPLLKKAIEIVGDQMSEKSGNYQKIMVNLAILYQEIGRYEEAEEIYLRAIELKEKRFSSRHPDYAHMLNNLASLYVLMGKEEKVEDLLKRSAQIYQDNFGPRNPSYATTISNLGSFYRYKARYSEAEPLLDEALSIRNERLGESNPLYVKSQEDLAILYWKTGRIEEAAFLFTEVLDKSIEFIDTYFPPMSESEKTKYWDKLRPRFQRFYAFTLDSHGEIPGLVGQMYNYRLATKALLLNATNKIKKRILESGNQELINEYLDWLDQKENLARLYGYSKEELDEENINLDSLERVANETERQLSAKSDIFSSGYAATQIDYEQVKNQLGPREAAVELIQTREYTNQFTDKILYAALILTKDRSDPRLVVLENGNQLESRYYSYYKNAIKQQQEDEYSYSQYWQAIFALIQDQDHVYLSLDGIYNQINLNTLRNPQGAYVIDEIDISLVGNTKDIVENAQRKPRESNRTAVMMGFPDYGPGGQVAPLPGTKKELQNIQQILAASNIKTEVYLAKEASEEIIKEVNNPSILHIATHGFFLTDLEVESEKVFGIEVEKAKNNPLLRSGLMLAGAEKVITGEFEISTNDNGILTAYEAMNLQLDATDIVVLSACETGLGDVKEGEGVYGLQRAFMVAGSQSVVMSLWKVSDEATQALMTDFYKIWLQTGDKRAAFKKAQLNLKSRYAAPYYWGAFVLVGV